MSIKEPQTTLNVEERALKSYWKNTNKCPGIEFALFNCTGEMGMDNFGYVNSSLYFIL